MSGKSLRGADLLVRTLQRAGVRHLFTLSGNHIMPVFDAAIDAGIDSFTRATRRPRCTWRTPGRASPGSRASRWSPAGPGHANAVSALYTRADGGVAGGAAVGPAPHWRSSGRGAFQEMRQADDGGAR